MPSLNRATIMGHLGSDPVSRYTPTGTASASMSVATQNTWTDKASRKKQEKTEWHRVVLFGSLAENASKYLKKGSCIYVEGRIETRTWVDKKTNTDRTVTEIIATGLQFIGRPPGDAGNGPPIYNNPTRQRPDQMPPLDEFPEIPF